jgi:hypothetical protein
VSPTVPGGLLRAPVSASWKGMNRAPIGFVRKFEFTVPLSARPASQPLRAVARLLRPLGRSDSRRAARSPREEAGRKMVAPRTCRALARCRTPAGARVDDYLAGAAALTATDLSNRKTDDAQHNRWPIDDILAEFRSARARLRNRAEQIDPSTVGRPASIPHGKPLCGWQAIGTP